MLIVDFSSDGRSGMGGGMGMWDSFAVPAFEKHLSTWAEDLIELL